MKKLLYITNRIDGSGGLERVLSVKASYFADHLDYEVHLITLNQKSMNTFYVFSQKIHHHNLDCSNNKIKFYLNYLSGVRSQIRLIKPDVICICDDGLKAFSIPFITPRNVPVILEKHASKNLILNTDSESLFNKTKFKLFSIALDIGAKLFDQVVVLTKKNRLEWRGSKKIAVIPNPLPFIPEKLSTLNNKVVLTIGNHGFQKGIDRLVNAWHYVNEKHPDWRLEVYGKIDDEKKYLKLAQRHKIDKTITFSSPVKNIEEKYRKASIYALPSRSEGFGMVLIEAMITGVPCVAFNCPGGPSDIVKNGFNGILVPNNDIRAFSNGIIELIENKEKRHEYGKNSRTFATQYTPSSICRQWDNLFEKLISQKKI